MHDTTDIPIPQEPGATDDRAAAGPGGEEGMATAELLGNAALGIAALVAIWAVLQAVGLDVMDWIRAQLQV
ncbi:MAG: hypothetical protein ACKOA9_12490 [Actinomycetota bacterium]